MQQDSGSSVLRRLLRPAGTPAQTGEAGADGPLTPARVLRGAVTRGAEAAAGLRLTVLGVDDCVLTLDEALSSVAAEDLILAIAGPRGPEGLGLLDLQFRAALIEAQTLGHPAGRPAAPRPPTGADAALVRPVLAAVLADLCNGAAGTDLEGWADGLSPAGRLDGARAAALVLAAGDYRRVRLTLDLGAGDRQGLLTLVLPPRGGATRRPPDRVERREHWATGLRTAVLNAPADFDAVLHRMRLPLSQVEGMAPGQVIPLPGVTVASLRLEGPGRRLLAQARLGQIAGLRAVRLERPAPSRITEIRAPGAGDPPEQLAAPPPTGS